ncbi:MAG: penicillin-binding protein 2, partial [Thermodesulfovibrionia bacterium]
MEKRISVGTYIIVFLFIVFILRLWDLQIIKGEKYKEIAEQNRLRMVEILAPRGLIYDRNNIALVRNIPSFDISVIKEDLSEDPDTLSALGRLVGLKPEDIKARLERGAVNPFEPVKLRQNVSMEEVARVEAGKIDFPGLLVEVVVSREYIYGDFASHVMGYLGKLTIEQMKNPDYYDVPRRAFTGQRGAEKVFDRTLMGKAGKKVIEVDAMGRIIDVASILQPVKGGDIILTIDMKLQAEAEDALKGKVGAVVALDPNTGEILVLASKPSFDPNLFARGIDYKDWKILVNDTKKPFLNRAIQSQYPPGSTFKVITAIAALEKGIITDNTVFECKGSIHLGRIFRCWKREGHGNIKLHRAIVESCDVYFYEIGKRLGIDTLSQYASDFGLGKPVGVELEGERAGIVPTVAWKLRTKKEKWYKGETLNAVIGQGYLSATPIQMARLMAAVVNGGKLFRPHILKVEGSENRAESTIVIKPENIRLIKKALMSVVSDPNGTGRFAYSDIVKIGGKTGTTQVVGGSTYGDVPEKYRDHAWFIAFAPEENPQISVSVFIEHGGHGSTVAAPIAKRVIEAFYRDRQKIKNQN